MVEANLNVCKNYIFFIKIYFISFPFINTYMGFTTNPIPMNLVYSCLIMFRMVPGQVFFFQFLFGYLKYMGARLKMCVKLKVLWIWNVCQFQGA